jgi:hypothetical protein
MRSLMFATAALFAISCGPALAAAGGASAGAASSGNGNGGGGGNGHTPPAVQSTMPKVQPPSYGVTTGSTMSGTSGSRSTMGSSSTRNGASASNSTTANTQQ